MSTPPPPVSFRRLVVPASVDAPDAADFVEMVRVRNQVYRERSGHDDHALTPAELLPILGPDPAEVHELWVVLDDDRMIGRFGVDLPTHPGSRVAFWFIEILAAERRRGIGSAAYHLVEETARAAGRSVLQAWAEQPASGGARIPAPTGFGSVPDDGTSRFFLRHGYTLEQVERVSTLDLHADPSRLRALHRTAEEAAEGYTIVQWSPPTPSEFADDYAWMKSRMNTDAPNAGIEIDEEVWDRARIAHHDSQYLDADRLLLVTAARHTASGRLVAFNELVIGADRSLVTSQEDTLVLREHRGHRLGMLVKTAALLRWREIAPDSPRVITWNAEENRPMLDINEAVGFVPIAYEGVWKKTLDG